MSDDLRKLATVICNKKGLGTSSKTIVAYCTGVECCYADRPYDAGDVSRCISVLSFFPEWKEKIKHISDRFPRWGTIGEHWDEIETAFNAKHRNEECPTVCELLDRYGVAAK